MKPTYFILSLSHGQADGCCLWWRPECKGYTKYLHEAGYYSQSEVDSRPEYFNNGRETKAIPVDGVLAKTVQVVPYPFPE